MVKQQAVLEPLSDVEIADAFMFLRGAEFLGLAAEPEMSMAMDDEMPMDDVAEPVEMPATDGEHSDPYSDPAPEAMADGEAGGSDDVEEQVVVVEAVIVEAEPAPSFFGSDPDPIETFLWKFYEPGGQAPAASEIGLSPGKLVRLGPDDVASSPGSPKPVSRLRLSPADVPAQRRHWNPVRNFGKRQDVIDRIGAADLPDAPNDVHVVIVDNGLNRDYIESIGGTYAGGFSDAYLGTAREVPGTADPVYGDVRDHHGHMIARNVLSLAPNAKIYDCPLLPNRVSNVDSFVVVAENAFLAICDYASRPENQGNWVLVNAWALRDREEELLPETDPVLEPHYTTNPNHSLNKLVTEMARTALPADGGFDFVFAAGNCGQFTTGRCGPYDKGAGQSIWGANALQDVLCVGAVTVHDQWIGSSSQGAGPFYQGPGDESWALKPDLCAPSRFCEDHDLAVTNSGSSASCGIAAGAVARLRADPDWAHSRVSSEKMIRQLRAHARRLDGQIADAQPSGLRWNNRTGTGFLNLRGISPDGVPM